MESQPWIPKIEQKAPIQNQPSQNQQKIDQKEKQNIFSRLKETIMKAENHENDEIEAEPKVEQKIDPNDERLYKIQNYQEIKLLGAGNFG